MEYNTVKPPLAIKEYGRNIQDLINQAIAIEDREYRQAFTEKIVDLMFQMNTPTRNVEDFRLKLWSHVFQIADYKLDVDAPISTERPEADKGPDKVNYPDKKIRFRHYGRNVHKLVQKAIGMEDEDKKAIFANIIGAYMKMAYRAWNRETVSDEIIKSDLERISDGQLKLGDEISLDSMVSPNKRNFKKRKFKNSGQSQRNGRKKNNFQGGRKNDKRRRK